MKVADFSTHYSGPLASHLLAELGADVVKVESPVHGDGNRGLPPIVHDESLAAVFLNSGVRSLAIDRRSEEFPAVVSALGQWADVVIVGERQTVLSARGLDFGTFAKANSGIVYCMVSPYGSRGPWKDWSAHGQSVEALAGNLRTSERDDGHPGTPAEWRTVGTTAAGILAALGILSALERRHRHPEAVCVEVSLWGAAMWWHWRDTLHEANVGAPWTGFSDAGPRYAVYRTADDRLLMIAPVEQKFWTAFCDVVGLPAEMRERGDWTTSRMDQGGRYPEERDLIQAALRRRTMDDWVAVLAPAGIPVAPLLTRAEALESEHARAEEVLATVPARTSPGATFQVPRLPVRFSGVDPTAASPPSQLAGSAPLLGEHTQEVLDEIARATTRPRTKEVSVTETEELVKVEEQGSTVILRLSNPPVNAISPALMAELQQRLTALAERRDLSALVLSAEGERAFCGGVDLRRPSEQDDEQRIADLLDGGRQWRETQSQVRHFPVPVVAAVDGPAIGAGFGLVAMADIIVASDRASFGLTEINVGLLGGASKAVRMLGPYKARMMLFSGELVPAAELHRRGALEELVPAGRAEARAIEIAEQFARKSPIALRLAKESVIRIEDMPLEDAYRLEQDYTFRLRSFKDSREALAAFRERREPRWTWS